MNDLGRLARWFGTRVTRGHVALRLLWAVAAVFVLFYGFFAALAYEAVRLIDRGGRLSTRARWGAAIAALLVVLAASSAFDDRNAVAVAPAAAPASPTPTPSPSPTPTAAVTPTVTPTVQFAVLSPRDGESVADAHLVVSGVAPPGARVVQDISFAPDHEAFADEDGSWSISLELRPGENRLRFRLDSDRSTEQELTVIFVEQSPSATATPTPTQRLTPSPRPARPGPTATPDPWPTDFEIFVCAAVREIDDAGDHLAQAGAAAQDFDIDRMIEESERAAQDAREARDYLRLVPGWTLGENAVTALEETAQLTIEAANLLKLGGQTLDPAIIEEAALMMEEAFDAKIEASIALVELEEATGFSCF